MSIIIFELSATRERFETVFNSFLQEKNIGFLPLDKMKLDEAYSSMVNSLSSLILLNIDRSVDKLKENEEHKLTIESIIDTFNYYLYTEFGIDVQFEKLHQLVSGIETALMNDIIKVLPSVDDDSVKVIAFSILPPNNLSVEYLIDNSVEYQQFTTEAGIKFSEPVNILANYKYSIPLKPIV